MQNWIFDIRSRPFVLLLGTFLIITTLVFYGVTEVFDKNTILFFKSVNGNPVLDILMQTVTEFGDVYYMLAFAVVLTIIRKTRRLGATLMILLVLTTLTTGYIKCGIDRDRPALEYEGTPFIIPLSTDTFSLFCEGGYNASYPSGHAARAAVFGIVLGFVLSERFPRGCYLLLIYPVLMSLSRIYVLHHYPMDVIGGALLGVFLAGAVSKRTKLFKIFKKSIT